MHYQDNFQKQPSAGNCSCRSKISQHLSTKAATGGKAERPQGREKDKNTFSSGSCLRTSNRSGKKVCEIFHELGELNDGH